MACDAKMPYLKIGECKEHCTIKSEITKKRYKKGVLDLEFGVVLNCCGVDTLKIMQCGDTLFLKSAYLKRLHERTGADTLNKKPMIIGCECDCFYNFEVRIDKLNINPKFIIVNNYISDEKQGFINLRNKSKNQICCPDK